MTEERKPLLAIFDDVDGLTRGVRAMVDSGNTSLEALTPMRVPELDEVLPQKPSTVRWFTLLGCIAGAVLGLAFQIMTVLQWPHYTGGKPIVSLPAFVVVSFEMSILFGAFATLAGLMINGALPPMWKDYYWDGCSRTDFALLVQCESSAVDSTKGLLSEAGARDVRAAERESVWPEIEER